MKLRVAKWDTTKEGNETTPDGLIRVNPNKPDFGSIMLINTGITLTGGFANKRTKVGFVVGSVEDLQDMIKEYTLKDGVDFSVASGVDHKIVTTELVESAVPENRGYSPKINPETKEELFHGEERIFRRTDVVLSSDLQTDVLLQHNTDEVGDASKQEFVGSLEKKSK